MLPANAEDRRFEDYEAGAVHEFGSVHLTEDEIVAFARLYDPQDMHTDPVLAATGPFGGLIASGWHTVSMMMRMMVDDVLKDSAGLGSPGVDELRWLKPVRPGDTLHVRLHIVEAKRSQSRPDRGTVRARMEVVNQSAQTVLTCVGILMFGARRAGQEP